MLADHLKAVGQLTAAFAERFHSGAVARALGRLHDIGKLDPEFQRYLTECESNEERRRGPEHRSAGAILAEKSGLGLAAMTIFGHHGGLRSLADMRSHLSGESSAGVRSAVQAGGDWALSAKVPEEEVPTFVRRRKLSAEMWVRMLFSALVDADYLDTERHFEPARTATRKNARSLGELLRLLLDDGERRFSGAGGHVNEIRREILDACLSAAELEPGMFMLAVPTGGGKTRSGMAFALRHCARWGLERVIVVAPYITITEQTADVYRGLFEDPPGQDGVVLEHHSNLGEPEAESFAPRDVWHRLAAENWDAPIVVTTAVQLFESMFAASPSRCRKLHRLTNSVVILDEAQMLPPHLLHPILDCLRELTQRYRTSVVLSTATQPAFDTIGLFRDVVARPIVPDAASLYSRLRRVRYEWRDDRAISWEEMAGLLRQEHQVLAIVNTRQNARDLMTALEDPEALHLSTLLCGAHRRDVLRAIRDRLDRGDACRVVSTQLVEAGVDIDFPVVMRAMAPLDSVIQAAGRANREGALPEGRVIVVEPEAGGLPPGAYAQGAQHTRALRGEGRCDPDDPASVREYFRRLYQIETDREKIQQWRSKFDYPEVQRRFRMIDDETESVVVHTYGSAEDQRRVREQLDRLRDGGVGVRRAARALQPFIVSVRRAQAALYRSQGLTSPVVEGLSEWAGGYDDKLGLMIGEPGDVVA